MVYFKQFSIVKDNKLEIISINLYRLKEVTENGEDMANLLFSPNIRVTVPISYREIVHIKDWDDYISASEGYKKYTREENGIWTTINPLYKRK